MFVKVCLKFDWLLYPSSREAAYAVILQLSKWKLRVRNGKLRSHTLLTRTLRSLIIHISLSLLSHLYVNNNLAKLHPSPTRHLIMSSYGDEPVRSRRPRDDRPPPYTNANSYDTSARRPPPPQQSYTAPSGGSNVGIPPPPIGASAMKREGSRSRVPHLQPQFPDERSYLASEAPDAERKNRTADRRFRDKRDGYESEEGQMHRSSSQRRRRGGHDDDVGSDRAARRQRPKDPYEDEAPRRRRKDTDYDDEPAPRRRDRNGYDSEPLRRRNTERPRDKKRRDEYSSDSDSDYDRRPRRRRSDDYDRAPRYDRRGGDDKYGRVSDRRDRDRDRDRYGTDRPRYRDDRYDDGYDRDRRRRAPREIKVGKYDIGPYVDQGQKHYKTLAPILTPIMINLGKKYLSGGK